MKLNRMLPPIALGLAILGSTLATRARADADFVAGEIILYMQPGVPKADAEALAATVNPLSVTPLLLQDCYVLELPAVRRNNNDTTAAVAALRADARVRYVKPSLIYRPTQVNSISSILEPNDPRYKSGEQWNLKLINMPQAWVLQRGAANVNLGWIDSGYDPAHEDAMGQFDPGSFDFADNDSNITADGTNTSPFDHGTATSGIAFAKTDNSIGVAGICWQNIKCVALKIQKANNANLDGPAILNSYAYILANFKKLHIVAVNMSYGAAGGDPKDTTAPDYVATKALVDAGVLMIASAGNSGGTGNPTVTPSGYPHIISVGALDRNRKITPYSSFGKVDIAAPGGDMGTTGNAADGVLALLQNSKYGFEDGTSSAAPHVTAVVGLLMSVPGVTPQIAKDVLLQTAEHASLPVLPDPKYGYGILDAYAALARVSIQATILSPDGLNLNGNSSDPSNLIPPPVETFKPTISAHFNNVTCDNVTITLDASIPSLAKTIPLSQLIAGNLPQGITDFNIVGACIGVPNPNFIISFRVAFPTIGFFQHTVTIKGIDTNSGLTATDTRLFTITPHTIPSGLSMISIPYYEPPADAPSPYTGQFRDVPQLLGTTATLYRYLLPAELGSQVGATVGPYAKLLGSDPKANINASFRPQPSGSSTPALVTPTSAGNGQVVDTRPIGLGYFIDAPAAIPVITFGMSFPTSPFKIPLHEGWNIVGDPYTYSVPFNSLVVETSTGAHLPISQAVDQKLILPHIYRFVNGDYQFSTLPDGLLQSWEGHWVYVVPRDSSNLNPGTVISLIVTPTPAGGTLGRSATVRSSASATRAAGSSSWKLQLRAHVGDKSDSNNFVGMAANATDGNDRTKVPKPPKPDSTVSLSLVRSDSPSMAFAQDLRSLGGTKLWNFVVATDKANANVTVEWPNARTLPKNYSVILTDQVTGRSLDVRNASSYQFNSGSTPGTRSFSLVARPTAGISGHPLFTNIIVNPSRAGGRAQSIYNIGYSLSTPANVSVSIMTAGGHTVAQIVTRAVTSGDNSLSWNGLDAAGHAVAAGSYILQFQAATTEGQTSRVSLPLILTGR